MANYPQNTIYLCEPARTSSENPITTRHDMLILAVVVDRDTGEIFDAEVNSICDITSKFVCQLLVGHRLRSDVEHMVMEIKTRYHGASSGSLISAIRACAKKLEANYPAAKAKK